VLVLLFDGTCGICTRMVRWLRNADRAGHVEALPSQLPGLIERYGLTREAVDREVWAFDAAGNSWAGAAAIFRVLEALGGPWPMLAHWARRTPFKQLSAVCYRAFARHRRLFARWGVPPECADPARGCLPP
jgi:predicted DCC family thiol-disulfide oxidoreductase YuxK